jgi:PKD repeat protein
MKRKILLAVAGLIIPAVLFLSGCSLLNQSPIASFTASPTSGKAPLEVDFDASGSSDPNGTVESYDWTFGDGESGDGEQPTHTYEGSGEYTAKLTVTDNGGSKDSFEKTISVEERNQQPTASFTASATSGSAPFHVNFNSDSSDPDGTVVSHEWDLGDGTVKYGDTASHTYYSSGDYEVSLTVTDNEGATGTMAQTLTLPTGPNRNPSASFTANPESGSVPLDVTFDASGSTDPDGEIDGYDWNFGDGESGSGVTTDHTFDETGTFTVTLTVTDDDGATSSVDRTIEVTSSDGDDPGEPPMPS